MLLRARREDRHRARTRRGRGHARKGQWRGIDLPFLQLGLLPGRRRAARDTRTALAGSDVIRLGFFSAVMKYFYDFSISYRRGRLSIARFFSLKDTTRLWAFRIACVSS